MRSTMGLQAWLVLAAAVFAGMAQAEPLPGSRSTASHQTGSAIEKVHGFHCREEMGWDPRTGLYRRHSHMGICENYKRCLEVHHRCIFLNGRGFDSWRYERWGWDNYRYTSCMLERGCY